MGPRVVTTRVIGTALVVLCGSGASGSVADEAISGELGPVRQWVAQRDGVYGSADVPIGLPKPLQAPLQRPSDAGLPHDRGNGEGLGAREGKGDPRPVVVIGNGPAVEVEELLARLHRAEDERP